MSKKLAIDGGVPVFWEKPLDAYQQPWPIPHPETEQKLLEIYRSGKWSMCGKYEQMLGPAYAKYQGSRYSVWMSNGTVTLECALLALGIGPGDEVIVPGISWLATAEAPLYVGATPVIVDVDPDTMCIDPKRIEEAITPRTKAIIPVHIYSALADMPEIVRIADRHGLVVIEDCAHAHGCKQKGRGIGTFGKIGSFSFQLSKLMTAGEGGCCTTDDEELCDRLHRLSHIGSSRMHPGTTPDPSLMCHQYRFTEFQAAIIYDQLAHQKEYFEKRKANGALLAELIRDVPGIEMQKSAYDDDERGYYFTTMLLKLNELHEGITRQNIHKALAAEGLGMFFGWGTPLYKSVIWNIPKDKYILRDTPNCEEIMYKRVLVKMHSVLLCEREAIEKMAEAIRKVMTAYAG